MLWSVLVKKRICVLIHSMPTERTVASLRQRPIYYFTFVSNPANMRILRYATQVFRTDILYELMHRILNDWYRLRRMYDEGKFKTVVLIEAMRDYLGFDLEEIKARLDEINMKLDKLLLMGYDVAEAKKILYELRSKLSFIEKTMLYSVEPRVHKLSSEEIRRDIGKLAEESKSTDLSDLPDFIRDNPWTNVLSKRRKT